MLKISQDFFLSGSLFLDNQFFSGGRGWCGVCVCFLLVPSNHDLLQTLVYLRIPRGSFSFKFGPFKTQAPPLDILMCQENVLKHKQATSPTLVECRICG